MKEYKIETLEDMAKIPADRLAAFWPDLQQWILSIQTIKATGIEPFNSSIKWIDDGENNFDFNITIIKPDESGS